MPTTQRILIVDDDPTLSAGLSLLLEDHETEVAGTCREALALAEAFRPDAMLIDIGLPDGNGVRLYHEITERVRDPIPVVFCSGHAEPSDLGDLRERREVAFLRKPFEERDLLEALDATTRSRNPS